ncbi:MAG TPA: FAD-dependent oxidoreductase [Steroidobacteraceae bacterium]
MDPSTLPDFRAGIETRDLADGAILPGRVDSAEAILVRRGAAYFAVGAQCTHYHGALASGLIVNDTIRCPLHHACFSLRSGAALRAPALDAIPCWRVELVGDRIFVRDQISAPPARAAPGSDGNRPASIVIVGGGAAGLAAADMLRREGYAGTVTIISADESAPYDRPNLSKDFLAGSAPAEWMPLRGAEYYAEQRIDLMLNARVATINAGQRLVHLADGRQLDFGSLLLATGADPVHLDIPGSADMPRFYLRSFADSRAIVNAAATAKRALIVGASFIGLEVAASLRQRGLEVHVVGPERIPLERVLGPEIGGYVAELHRLQGVVLHLGTSVSRLDGMRAILSDGSTVDADVMVLGVGVRPTIALAAQAGLAVDRGISVNEFLETSATGIFAAGDAARWPDPHSGNRIRVEHWVVAERQGQVAALNMIGRKQPYDAVPFFWSQHYDVTINYVGHAESWDAVTIEGSPSHDCAATYTLGGRIQAVATISRHLQSLVAERDFELMRAST